MHRSIIRLLALFACLTALSGCLVEIAAPPPRPEPSAAPPTLVEGDEDLDALLRDADARIAAAPPAPAVGESALDHDHDHAQCEHDHDHEHHGEVDSGREDDR